MALPANVQVKRKTEKRMSLNWNRREFLQRTVVAGGVTALSGSLRAQTKSPNEKLNIGIIGVANRGGDNLFGVQGENIVALCDIDDNYLVEAKMRFPKAETFNDYRKMLERKDLDAVVVSTPDHNHAPATALALHTGHHVYCEKPLAHTVYEARKISELSKKMKRVTQMGTQIHATSNYRRVVEMIQAGAIGPVREVHVWSDKKWVGKEATRLGSPIPPNIHWDIWLGPAKNQSFNPDVLPANWRGYWEFGNGTLGDMACHHMDLPFWALKLRHPTRIAAEGPPVHPLITPDWLIVHYEFPEREGMPPVKLHWYNGGKRPELFVQGKLPQWGDGNLFIGDKGMLLADYDRNILLPEEDFKDYKAPLPSIPDSIGHHKEWIEACKSGGATTCNFDYSGALSEAVLLGCVAYRAGEPLQWDAKSLKVLNHSNANSLIRTPYRRGWSL